VPDHELDAICTALFETNRWQTKLAACLGMSQKTVHRWTKNAETGRVAPGYIRRHLEIMVYLKKLGLLEQSPYFRAPGLDLPSQDHSEPQGPSKLPPT